MKIFLTGGSGFIGKVVSDQLLNADYQVKALARSKDSLLNQQVETAIGDTTDKKSLTGLLAGCDAIIHLVGIIREFPRRDITFNRLHFESTRNLVQAAQEQGVSRFLHMSANGARAGAVTGYHRTKWAAEEQVRQSGLDWTIFRPSLVFGPKDLFVNMLADLIRKLPVTPVMGDGRYRIQPVSVNNVAEGFIKALESNKSIGKSYHCGGPIAYSYDEVLDLIGSAMGKKAVRKFHQPLLLMKPVVSIMESIPQFPMTSDQLQMLLEENICDPSEWAEELNINLIDFAEGIAEYIY